ncbi:sensor histidine kinase [Shewanella surugensis]|uniref:histidine kinase n=1 Tax=Shewanella surugensis TaxID=212020 RepID=A0ABT0LE31_9GAMM|nr:ATP-binding protein [Shewanella surugensis]MCL1125406.1 ATP-binding protein [Shewanella surugensis]
MSLRPLLHPDKVFDQLIILRALGLMLKIGLTFFAAKTFGLSLERPELIWVLSIETLFLLSQFLFRKENDLRPKTIFLSLLFDTLFWIAWLYFSGGATNAFISLLLLPIAVAAVLLPQWAAWRLTFVSTLAYSVMIFFEPENAMNMSSHYLGMWFNFVISSLVLTTSVVFIAQKIRGKEAELGVMREAQLRQEKLLALGVASAQMAHQLATPLSSLHLLADEVSDALPGKPVVIEDMKVALGRCEHILADLRLATESIRQQKQVIFSVAELINRLQQQLLLWLPQLTLSFDLDDEVDLNDKINADTCLLPVLIALVENAAHASQAQFDALAARSTTQNVQESIDRQQVKIAIHLLEKRQTLSIAIRDYGAGIPLSLIKQLGHQILESTDGMGIALLLSHASLERLGGRLLLSNHADGGAIAEVQLPILSVLNQNALDEDGANNKN